MATIRDVKFIDAKKRHSPKKHYVYVIAVTYNDSSVCVIRRRYSQFFDFQCALLDQFPDEAGSNKEHTRIIPFLPGKILFGRSQVRDVAMKRMSMLEDYCKLIIGLPSYILESDIVTEFFRPTKNEILETNDDNSDNKSIRSISEPWQPEQMRVLSDYHPKSKRELELEKGMIVETIEKNESGWWLVRYEDQFGWVPGNFLASHTSEDDESQIRTTYEQYVSTESYVAKNSDELSFIRGVIVEVLEKNISGWWLARYKEKTGLVPGVYFKKNYVKSPPLHLKSGSSSSRQSVRQKSVTSQRVGNGSNIAENFKKYKTISSFKSNSPGYVQFSAGQIVQVLGEDPSGWWYLLVNGKRGWAPSTYLRALVNEQESRCSPSNFKSSENCEGYQEHSEINAKIKLFEDLSKK